MAVPANQTAAWVEGFLRGSGLILIHDRALWDLIDQWVTGLWGEHLKEVRPLLRRTFATFPKPERRTMGENVSRGAKPADLSAGGSTADFNYDRANQVLTILKVILRGGGP